jgi:hypothetical protein
MPVSNLAENLGGGTNMTDEYLPLLAVDSIFAWSLLQSGKSVLQSYQLWTRGND